MAYPMYQVSWELGGMASNAESKGSLTRESVIHVSKRAPAKHANNAVLGTAHHFFPSLTPN